VKLKIVDKEALIRVKIKWDKQYLKIASYVVFTAIAIYILSFLVRGAVYAITHPGLVFSRLGQVWEGLTSVFSVAVIAFVMAYLLHPLVSFFQKRWDRFWPKKEATVAVESAGKEEEMAPLPVSAPHSPRTAGTVVTYVTVLVCLLVVICGFGMAVSDQPLVMDGSNGLSRKLLGAINKTAAEITVFYENAKEILQRWGVYSYAEEMLDSLLEFITQLFQNISVNVAGIVAAVVAAGGKIANFLIGLVVAFYFLRDQPKIKAGAEDLLQTFLSPRVGGWVRVFLGDVHMVFSGFIQGQLLDAAIVGLLMILGFSLIGLKFAVLIGLFSGFANIIPYLGPITGFILSVLVAFLSGDPVQALWAALVVIVVQQLDSLLISPRVVGEKVELSPVLVIIALAAGGSTLGLLGMVFAVPVFAVCKILLLRLVEQRKAAQARKNGL
jgi:predicted PurR-regulated permease PerM